MPQVPRYDGPQLQEQLAPNARQSAAPAQAIEAGGQAIARGLGQAADVTMDIYKREKAKVDSSAVLAARRKLLDWEAQNYDDPNNPGALYNNKGRSAIEVGDRLNSEYAKYRDQVMAELADDDQRQAFEPFAMQHEFSLRDRRNSYIRKEVDSATQEEFKVASATSLETYGRAAMTGDTKRMQAEMDAGVASVRLFGTQNDWSPEVIKYYEDDYRSKAHASALQGLIDNRDYQAAREYFDANDEDMQQSDRARYAGAINQIRNEDDVDDFLDRLPGGPAAANEATADVTFTRMIGAESNDQQFGKDGRVLMSGAGAKGAAQVLTATAEETARKHGIPWDPKRFETDKDYNKLIGRKYFDDQVKKYGSTALAAAAYNAGPGMVDDWLAGTNRTGKNPDKIKLPDPRKGEASAAEFARQIPFAETRNYVQKTALGGVTGDQSAAMTLGDKLRAIDENPTFSKEQKHLAKARVRERDQIERQEEAQRNGDISEAIARHLTSGGTMTNLPPDLRARAQQYAPEQLLAFEKSARTGGGATQTDQVRYYELVQMATNEPYKFADYELRNDLPKLSDSDFQELTRLKAGIKSGKDTKALQSLKVQSAVAKPLLVAAGLAEQKGQSITWKKGQEKRGALFYRELDTLVKSHRERTGKEPGPEDIQNMADRLLIQSTYTVEDGGFAFFDSEDTAYYFELPLPARRQLKEGVVTRFGNGQAWTMRNGNPTRIK